MTLLSYVTPEVDKIEEDTPKLPLKPMVLPTVTMSLKVAWKANRVKLEKAGVFNYLCWIQSITRLAYVEEVTQFVQTYSMNTETPQVNGRTIDFSVDMVARHLWLPKDGLLLEKMHGLTKKQHGDMFEEEFPRTPKGCRLDKDRHHWKPWLKFVNDYLVFRPQKEMMTQRIIVAALNTWEGKRINWAQIIQ